MNNEKIPDADIHAVILDLGYTIGDADKPFIEKVESVFLFDKNETTNLCEITSSYDMRWVADRVVFTKAGWNLSQKLRDELIERWESPPPGADRYIHCHIINTYKSKQVLKVSFKKWVEDEGGNENTWREKVMEQAIEMQHANPVL